MDYQAMYQQKLTTAEEAVKVVRSGDWVDYTWCTNHPIACLLYTSRSFSTFSTFFPVQGFRCRSSFRETPLVCARSRNSSAARLPRSFCSSGGYSGPNSSSSLAMTASTSSSSSRLTAVQNSDFRRPSLHLSLIHI